MNIHAKKFTEGGRAYVRIPENEYHELLERLENAEDVKDAKSALTRIADGEETFPSAFVSSLLGASPGKRVALWRKYRGLTSDALGRMVGTTGAAVRMMESGKRSGSISTLKNIAEALHCELEDIA